MTRSRLFGLSHQFILLIVALLVLLAGTALVFQGEEDEAAIAIPVRLEQMPSDLIALQSSPPVFEAHLKGPSEMLKALGESDIHYTVDVSTARPGPLSVRISPDRIPLPRDVSVLKVEPAVFDLSIEKRTQKTVPVVVDLVNDPAPDYVVSQVVIVPSKIGIGGPLSILEGISAVRTTPIDVGGLTESIKKQVALNINHAPHVQAAGESLVEVEIVVEQKTIDRWLSVAIEATGGKKGCVITPDRIDLLLRGPVQTVKALSPDNGVEVYVDTEGLAPGTYVRRAVITPPLDIALVEAKPEVFTIKVLKPGK